MTKDKLDVLNTQNHQCAICTKPFEGGDSLRIARNPQGKVLSIVCASCHDTYGTILLIQK